MDSNLRLRLAQVAQWKLLARKFIKKIALRAP
jgi:hypothetical protein